MDRRSSCKHSTEQGLKRGSCRSCQNRQRKCCSAVTHLKSPSSFSCCTSLDTIGLINTLLTIVPMTKYPKMLTGPSQPVLQRRRKKGRLRSQTKGHSSTPGLEQSEPSTVTSLHLHRTLWASTAQGRSPLGVQSPLTHTYNAPAVTAAVVTWVPGSKTEQRKEVCSGVGMGPYLWKHWYV